MAICISGCSHQQPNVLPVASSSSSLAQESSSVSISLQCDNKTGYCIDFDGFMNERKWTNDWTGLSGAPTAHTLSNGLNPENANYVRVDIYHSPSPHCQNLGASHPDITEDKTQGIRSVQGYVDYFDTMDTPVGNPDPPCRPPGGKDSAAYVFCSEKDGKQVVICISQQTANLALAQKIFSTFRWTDQ